MVKGTDGESPSFVWTGDWIMGYIEPNLLYKDARQRALERVKECLGDTSTGRFWYIFLYSMCTVPVGCFSQPIILGFLLGVSVLYI